MKKQQYQIHQNKVHFLLNLLEIPSNLRVKYSLFPKEFLKAGIVPDQKI
jgi:hypothetical protein